MSTNEIARMEDLDLPISNIPESQLAKLSERAYLSFIKVCSSDKDMATNKPGTILLCKDATNKKDVGKPIEFMVIAARPLACHTTLVGIDRFYDMESKEYKEVQSLAEKPNHMGDWWGTDYLLYLRAQRQWVSWHASSETHRQRAEILTGILTQWSQDRRNKKLAIQIAVEKFGAESAEVKAAQAIIVPNPQASMTTELVHYKKFNSHKWAAVLAPVTTPFSEVPAFEEIREKSLKFQNPPKSEKEELDTAEADAPKTTRG